MRPITAEQVRVIMETSLPDAQITAYIGSANTFVNSTLLGKGLSDGLLVELERWITAHMIALTAERTTRKEEAGTAKVEYAGQFGKSFEATSYGQMALVLDTSGTLKDLMDKKQARFTAIQTP